MKEEVMHIVDEMYEKHGRNALIEFLEYLLKIGTSKNE